MQRKVAVKDAGDLLNVKTCSREAPGMTMDELRDHTARKLAFVRSRGVKEIVYFVGPVWFPDSIRAASVV